MDCLFSTSVSSSLPPPSQGPVMHRIDFGYLRPEILSINCNKKDLEKFEDDFLIWIKKTFGSTEETKLVWASLRSVLDKDWVEVLNRDPKTSEKSFHEIFNPIQGGPTRMTIQGGGWGGHLCYQSGLYINKILRQIIVVSKLDVDSTY